MQESVREDVAGSIPLKWNELQEQQTGLYERALSENSKLADQVKELERELSVWKIAHEVVHTQNETLSKETSRLKGEIGKWTGDKPLVVALVDGDGHIFISEHLQNGQAGGRQAAILLREELSKWLHDRRPMIANRVEILLTIFWNARGMRDTLLKYNICTGEQFDGFCHGFNQSAHLFSIVDAGYGKEAADAKIKEHLRLFSHFPQTEFIFFGGGHDNGYTSTLASIATEGLLDKIVLIKGYSDIAAEIKNFRLPELSTTGIFMPKKLATPLLKNSKFLNSEPPQLFSGYPTDGGEGYMSPTKSYSQLGDHEQYQYSPSKALKDYSSHQNRLSPQKTVRKPCNFHYLQPKGCPNKMSCRYSHDVELNAAGIESMRQDARKTPCPIVNRGKECPNPGTCIFGHTCPQGAKCNFLKKGGCKFMGKEMHPRHDLQSQPSSGSNKHNRLPSYDMDAVQLNDIGLFEPPDISHGGSSMKGSDFSPNSSHSYDHP
ncbi:hypothetical protein HGRIS_007880 [Hohenbuehelia grisea]|uniref:C3H1-type domain-containing protein n=1 Tax=Hohenbuehelia grisea TaxID=104357 RepID=A0ABR3J7K7_9AGAR